MAQAKKNLKSDKVQGRRSGRHSLGAYAATPPPRRLSGNATHCKATPVSKYIPIEARPVARGLRVQLIADLAKQRELDRQQRNLAKTLAVLPVEVANVAAIMKRVAKRRSKFSHNPIVASKRPVRKQAVYGMFHRDVFGAKKKLR